MCKKIFIEIFILILISKFQIFKSFASFDKKIIDRCEFIFLSSNSSSKTQFMPKSSSFCFFINYLSTLKAVKSYIIYLQSFINP